MTRLFYIFFGLSVLGFLPIDIATAGYVILEDQTIFSDSGSYTGSVAEPLLIGSFTPDGDFFIEAGTSTAQFTYTNTSAYQSCDGSFYITIQSSSVFGGQVGSYHDENMTASLGQPEDMTIFANSDAILSKSQTYYVFLHSQCNPGNFEIENVILSATEVIKESNPVSPTTFFSADGIFSGSGSSPQLLGSFTPSMDLTIKADISTAQFTYKNYSGFSTCDSGFYIDISTSLSLTDAVIVYHDENMENSSYFPETFVAPTLQDAVLNTGQTYYVLAHSQCNPGNFSVEDISIATNYSEPPAEIDPLLVQYAPILYFHEDENYFPMNIEAFVEDSALWSTVGIGDTLLIDDTDLTFEEFENYVANNDTANTYLAYSDPDRAKTIDLDAALVKYNEAVNSGRATTTVYVHKMTDGYTDSQGARHDFIVLQYWFFYAMNNWGEYQVLGNNHEGDWESVFVFLDVVNEAPKYVAFSSHHNDGNPNFNVIQYDSVRRTWNEIDQDGNNVKSYVAVGSHANYSKNKSSGYPTGLAIDNTSSNGDIINIKNLENINDILTTASKWENYKGKWGTDGLTLGSNGPRGPKFIDVTGQVRFHHPVEWAGIDKYEEVTTNQPTSQILVSTAQFDFANPIPAGSIFSADQYDEFINFGINLENIQFLPRFWDFESSLGNNLPVTTITLSYHQAEIDALKILEQDLIGFYFNEATDAWEALQSTVNSHLNTVSFVTGHFSRYAIGVRKLEEVTDKVNIKQHWGKYDPKTAMREAGVILTSEPNELLRVLVSDITAPGTKLSNHTGITPDGIQFVDTETNETGIAEVRLVFNVPAKEVINTQNGETIYVPDKLKFDFNIEVQHQLET